MSWWFFKHWHLQWEELVSNYFHVIIIVRSWEIPWTNALRHCLWSSCRYGFAYSWGKLKSVCQAASVKAKSRQVLRHSGVLPDFEMQKKDAVSKVEVKFPDVLIPKARCMSLLIPTRACTATIIYSHCCKAYRSSGVFEYPSRYTLPAKVEPELSVQLESRVFDLKHTDNHRYPKMLWSQRNLNGINIWFS